MLEIPLTSDGEQIFSMVLDDILFDFRILYNSRANDNNGLWQMDISAGEISIINGAALVIGVDVMLPYNVGPSNLYMLNVTGSNADATKDNLGSGVKLFQLTDEEVLDVSSV